MTEKEKVRVNWTLLIIVTIGFLLGTIFIISVFKNTSKTEIQTEEPTPVKISNTSQSIVLKEPTYERNNLTAIFKDDNGTNILSFDLKSHPSIDYVKPVGVGDVVVIWYDINSSYKLENALEQPTFINLKTGKEINKTWKYVSLVKGVCNDVLDKNGTTYSNCTNDQWLDYNSKNLTDGIQTIGLKVNTVYGEKVDVILNVGGKRIEKHAGYTVVEAHGESLDTTGSVTSLDGLVIKMNATFNSTPVTLYKITKSSLATPTTARLLNDTNATVATAPFVGDVATFNNISLIPNEVYYVLANSNGSSYTRRGAFPLVGSFPYTNTYLSWISGFANGANSSVDMFNIVSVTLFIGTPSTLDVSLLNPQNNVNSTTTNLNFSANLTDLDSLGIANVSLYINGTINQTNSSGATGIYNFSQSLPIGTWNWTISAVDNTSNSTFSASNGTFNLNVDGVFKVGESYTASLYEGASSTFTANFTTNGTTVTIANLTYNGTGYPATITAVNSTFYTASKSLTAPTVTADTNYTFYWNTTLSSGYYRDFSTNNQTVLNVDIDDCSSYSNVLYNFTIADEEVQNTINTSTTNASVDFQIYDVTRTNNIVNYSNLYNSTNPFQVCLNNDLTGGETYIIDGIVQYSATNYATELYNIQNSSITSSSFPTNITLYDLNSTNSQPFKIIFRDSSFLPVEDALINIYRKYVSEGVFKIVEIPLTDEKGETLGHFVINDVIYNIEVVKYGVTLATFNNVLAVCQTPAISSCEIDLNAFADSIVLPDFETLDDFNFTLGYDNSTRIVSSIFSIPSGTVSMVSLNVTREDSLGTSVCSDVVTSSSGTLTCSVPTSFGNSTIRAVLYKDSVEQAQGNIKLDQTPADLYGAALVGISIFVMLTLIGVGLSNSPIITVIFLMVGVVLLFALNLVANNGFIGATATILWFVVAIIIVLIKGGARN